MNSKPKKVIVISDVRSDYIEQAILILKPEEKETVQNDFLIKEANAIIDNYNKRLPAERVLKSNQKKRFHIPLVLLITILIILSVCTCMLLYFN